MGDMENLESYALWLKMFRGEISISTFEVQVRDEADTIGEQMRGRMEARILGHEVAETTYGGLKNVTTYQISWQYWKDENDTDPQNGTVSRRYSDFDWLREIMCMRYRGMLVPPLPEKRVLNSSHAFLESRMSGLQFFLNEVVANPFLVCDHALALFLRHGAGVGHGGKTNASAKQEWDQVKGGILTDERNANIINCSTPLRLKVDASLGKPTTSSRCSPGYHAWSSHVDKLAPVPDWSADQDGADKIPIIQLRNNLKIQKNVAAAAKSYAEGVAHLETCVSKLAKKHASSATIYGHDPLKSDDERRLANLAKELSQVSRIIAVDGWASWAHDIRAQIQLTKRFVTTALERSMLITEALIELIDQHHYTRQGLAAVAERLRKSKSTQKDLEANPPSNRTGLQKYIPHADLEDVNESIMRDSRAVSTATAIAGREMKAIWWLELGRYRRCQAELFRKSFAIYASMRAQMAKDAAQRWKSIVKNMRCDESAEFALTGTISEPSAALALPLTVRGLPKRHRSATDVPMNASGDNNEEVDDDAKEEDDSEDARRSGGADGAFQSMAEDAEDTLFEGDDV